MNVTIGFFVFGFFFFWLWFYLGYDADCVFELVLGNWSVVKFQRVISNWVSVFVLDFFQIREVLRYTPLLNYCERLNSS